MAHSSLVGLISDTHGLLRPEAMRELQGADLILHAGDIGSPRILEQLATIATVYAVRGNNDRQPWAESIPNQIDLDVFGHRVVVIHDVHELNFDPKISGYSVVISGHSHRPRVEDRNGVLYVNPGSAGPRRFRLPAAIAKMRVNKSSITAEIVELLLPSQEPARARRS